MVLLVTDANVDLRGGTNITVTPDVNAKTLTIDATYPVINAFTKVRADGDAGTQIIPESASDALNFAGGTGITVSANSGTDTITITAFGECSKTLLVTVFTIPAFTPINSSLVIPGFLGIPLVTTTTSLPAVLV